MTHTHHTHFDRRTLFFAIVDAKADLKFLEAFFFTPVDFLSVSKHDARSSSSCGRHATRTKDVAFRGVQLSSGARKRV